MHVSRNPCTFAIFRGCISSAKRVFWRRSAWLLDADEHWPVPDWWQVMAADMVACLVRCLFHEEGHINGMLLTYSGAVPCLRRQVAGHSPPICCRGDAGSNLGQPTQDLYCTKWQWNRFLSEYFSFSLYHFTNGSYTFCHLLLTLYKLSKLHHRWTTHFKNVLWMQEPDNASLNDFWHYACSLDDKKQALCVSASNVLTWVTHQTDNWRPRTRYSTLAKLPAWLQAKVHEHTGQTQL